MNTLPVRTETRAPENVVVGSRRILLHVACNDPNNGGFTGRCGQIEIDIGGETAAALDCAIWPPSRYPRFSAGKDYVRIAGRKFSTMGAYKTWYGNWCWDAVPISAVFAADLLNFLRAHGWHNEGGFCDIGDQWDRGEKFRASDIARLTLTDEDLAARKAARGTV